MTKEKRTGHTVQKVNGFVFKVAYSLIRFYCFLCGVRVRTVNKVGKPENPSIILCNHGSFVDFVFVATLLGKYKPNFIIPKTMNEKIIWLLHHGDLKLKEKLTNKIDVKNPLF